MRFREVGMLEGTSNTDILVFVSKAVIVYGLIAAIIFMVLREILLEHWKRNQRRKD